MVNKEKKKPIYLHFYWFERTRSFAYVPVRDQNLVVRSKNYCLIGCVFFISFEKSFKVKSQSGKNGIGLYFLILKKWTQSRFKVDLKFD